MRFRVALVVAVLGLALVALLVEFKRVLQRPRRGAESPPPVEAEVDPPIAPAREPSPSSSASSWTPPRPAAPRRPTRIGVAHLKGRVVAPAGDEQIASDFADALDDLTVVADNGRSSVRAQRKPKSDRFELHLPPGRYTLTANAGDLVGVEPNLWLGDGVAREVTITLEPAVTVTGQIRGAVPDDVSSMVLYALRPGTTFVQGRGAMDGDGDGNSFTFSGLRDGHSYDLVFSGEGIRTTTIRGVSAPLEGLQVTLARLPVLRGAVGFARGTLCPLTRVRVAVTAPDDRPDRARPRLENDDDDGGDGDGDGDGNASADLEGDCRFELTLPADQPEVTVIATGPGWDVEERIAVPPEGDPPPICLNPPCRTDPLEGLANLMVRVEAPVNAAPNQTMTATVGEQGCGSSEGSCRVTGLPVGEPIEVAARGQGCIPEARTLTLGAGENAASFSCRTAAPAASADPSPLAALRRVQGILRTAGEAPEHLLIRCAGAGRERDLRNTLVFSTVCPRETAMLEYQLQREGPWTGVPIPTAADPALVEIAVGL